MISRRTATGVVALLVALTAVFMVVPAVATEPVYVETGVLRLHMGAGAGNDFLQFNTLTQTIAPASGTNCQLTSSGANLVSFSANTGNKQPFPGIKDDRIGVGQRGEGNGEPCARINKDLGQTLTLTLGTDLAGQKASYAEIDLGFKFNGTANIKAYNGGTQVDSQDVVCGTSSDCGPDSGSDDNKRAIVGSRTAGQQPAFVFDKIVISVVSPSNGAVSLEGGASEADRGPLGATLNTSDTLFQIVQQFDGELNCGQSTPLETDGAYSGTITRYNNVTGVCSPKPYSLTVNSADKSVTFDILGTQAAVYDAEITLDQALTTPLSAKITYDASTPYETFLDMLACDEAYQNLGGDNPDPAGSLNDEALPSGHTACVIDVSQSWDGTTVWHILFTADIRFK